jgi:hypothetical protein
MATEPPPGDEVMFKFVSSYVRMLNLKPFVWYTNPTRAYESSGANVIPYGSGVLLVCKMLSSKFCRSSLNIDADTPLVHITANWPDLSIAIPEI